MIYHQSHVYMKVYRTRGVIYNILSLEKMQDLLVSQSLPWYDFDLI